MAEVLKFVFSSILFATILRTGSAETEGNLLNSTGTHIVNNEAQPGPSINVSLVTSSRVPAADPFLQNSLTAPAGHVQDPHLGNVMKGAIPLQPPTSMHSAQLHSTNPPAITQLAADAHNNSLPAAPINAPVIHPPRELSIGSQTHLSVTNSSTDALHGDTSSADHLNVNWIVGLRQPAGTTADLSPVKMTAVGNVNQNPSITPILQNASSSTGPPIISSSTGIPTMNAITISQKMVDNVKDIASSPPHSNLAVGIPTGSQSVTIKQETALMGNLTVNQKVKRSPIEPSIYDTEDDLVIKSFPADKSGIQVVDDQHPKYLPTGVFGPRHQNTNNPRIQEIINRLLTANAAAGDRLKLMRQRNILPNDFVQDFSNIHQRGAQDVSPKPINLSLDGLRRLATFIKEKAAGHSQRHLQNHRSPHSAEDLDSIGKILAGSLHRSAPNFRFSVGNQPMYSDDKATPPSESLSVIMKGTGRFRSPEASKETPPSTTTSTVQSTTVIQSTTLAQSASASTTAETIPSSDIKTTSGQPANKKLFEEEKKVSNDKVPIINPAIVQASEFPDNSSDAGVGLPLPYELLDSPSAKGAHETAKALIKEIESLKASIAQGGQAFFKGPLELYRARPNHASLFSLISPKSLGGSEYPHSAHVKKALPSRKYKSPRDRDDLETDVEGLDSPKLNEVSTKTESTIPTEKGMDADGNKEPSFVGDIKNDNIELLKPMDSSLKEDRMTSTKSSSIR